MALSSGQINQQIWQQRQDAAEADRVTSIARQWDYYEGRHPLPLTVKPGAPDDNIIVNLARPIIDKGLSLLFGKPLSWQIDETASQTSDAEQFLSDVWTANDQQVLLHEVAQNGALSGLAAIKINPQPPGAPRPYRLINLDPRNLTLYCDDEDVDDIWRYRVQYTCADHNGAELVKRQDITRNADGRAWTIQNYQANGTDKNFRAVGAAVAWPYALAPIVHCKNLPCANSVWGYGDLEDVRLSDALNLIASSTRKILRIHASPQTLAIGFNPALLRREANQLWEVPEGGEVKNLEMESDLTAAREFYVLLRAALYSSARMPDLAQVGNLGALTNFGLRVLFADALERTDTKRLMYGGLIVRVNRLLCLLANKGENVTVKLAWPDPLPVNALEATQEASAKQATGLVSDETLTGELGYDYVDEQARLDDERAARQARAPKTGATGARIAPADALAAAMPTDTPTGTPTGTPPEQVQP